MISHLFSHLAAVAGPFLPLLLSGLVYPGRCTSRAISWQGVSPGGTATCSLPVNIRYHRIILQCLGIYFTGPSGTAVAAVKVKTADASTVVGSGTITPVIANGQIVSATATGSWGGTASHTWTVGDLVTWQDPTGYAAIAYVSAVTSYNPSAFNFTGAGASLGTACPLDPRVFFSSFRQVVNSQVLRDASLTATIGKLNFWGYKPQPGMLPLLYTEPWRNFLHEQKSTSWDMTGQGTFQLQGQINSNVASPSINSEYEYDEAQNTRTVTAQNQKWMPANPATGQPYAVGTTVPFLFPVTEHEYTFSLVTGQNDITTLLTGYPIGRIYVRCATPGSIYGVDVIADGKLIKQEYTSFTNEINSEYGLQGGSALTAPLSNGYGFGGATYPVPTYAYSDYVPTTIPNGALGDESGNSTYAFSFDTALAFDIDGRPWEALRCKTLDLRLYSNNACNAFVLVEAYPGAYLG
jgi:hypothetical protein